jgi:hypothetical protein
MTMVIVGLQMMDLTVRRMERPARLADTCTPPSGIVMPARLPAPAFHPVQRDPCWAQGQARDLTPAGECIVVDVESYTLRRRVRNGIWSAKTAYPAVRLTRMTLRRRILLRRLVALM